MTRLLRLNWLAGLLIVGGGLGGLLSQFTTAHRAEIALPIDPFTFRSVAGLIASPSELNKFGRATGTNSLDEYLRMESDLQNRSRYVTFDAVSRFKKKDWRDVPEAFIPKSEKDGRFLDVLVVATSSDPSSARRLAVYAMKYLRHILFLNGLREHLFAWGPLGRSEIARATEREVRGRAALLDNERRLNAVTEVRTRYKDQAMEAISGVQLQVSDTKVLSPMQQAIGLEVGRIEIGAQLREFSVQRAYHEALAALADEFAPKVESGEPLPDLSSELMKRITDPPTEAADPIIKEAHERARATVGVAVTELNARWLHAKTDPEEPLVQRVGWPRSVGFGMGAVVGFILWFGILIQGKLRRSLNQILEQTLDHSI